MFICSFCLISTRFVIIALLVDCLIEYMTFTSQLANIFTSENFDDICIIGDLNCDPFKGRLFNEFRSLTCHNAMMIAGVDKLPSDTYTYISSNSIASTSWLDHFFVSPDIINNISVLYGHAVSDLVPLWCEINLTIDSDKISIGPVTEQPDKIFFCEKVTDQEVVTYAENLEYLKSEMWQPVMSCSERHLCRSAIHSDDMDNLYHKLIEIIHIASSHLPHKHKYRNRNVPRWDEHCRELYSKARQKFLVWHHSDRLKSGTVLDENSLKVPLWK